MSKAAGSLSLPVASASGVTEGGGTLTKVGTDNLFDAVRKAETKLRKFLTDSGCVLTDRLLPEEKPADGNKKADEIPMVQDQSFVAPLRLDSNGKVCESVGSRAHDMRLSVGCHVELERPTGIKTHYVITSLQQDKMILEDVAEGKAEVEVKIDDMTKVTLLMPAKKRHKPVEVQPDTRMPGSQWDLIAKPDVDDCLKYWVYTAMFHIHVTTSPTASLVRIHQEQEGEQVSLDKFVKKFQLVLVPFAKEYVAKKTGSVHTFVPISYTMKAASHTESMVASSKGCTTLFWKLLGSSSHQPSGPTTLKWATGTMETPMKSSRATTQKDGSGLSKAATMKTLVIKFPYLTNTDDLPERSRLTVPPISSIPSV